ncbi:angiotensin-converting enzyme-like [Hyalella azteca]|uniref:Angiotensin-converting enzyme-like n=2 Tax=Hyalella azteca TaxID=294128 RepID=A0A8B7PR94_HYAAZ|nr:angiotensin-converting enzyme-like [Hyalella azteca]
MWAQSWENIYDIVVPYPDAPLIDISDTLNNSITDVKEMFDYAEGFFTSLGLYNMTEDFNTKSMREQPVNATAVCHASAWDFLSITDKGPITDGDFRIKMCTDKNQEDFITIHHEMGHIEYQMAYSQVNEASPQTQPLIFRDGANPGFHEAIGDTIALSVSTPSHLLGLQEDIGGPPQGTATTQAPVNQNHTDINQLMRMALEKVAFVPYAYILDKFRWDVFANAYAPDVYNYEWWKLR